MFNVTDILTLEDNKEYVVAADFPYEGKNYVCMTQLDNPKNVIFCEYRKDNDDVMFTDIEDEELIMSLMKVIHDKVVGPEESN